MPSQASTGVAKKRARTGCLICRQRRRKCDERKPHCENCEAKGLSCQYSIDLNFIPTTVSQYQRPGNTSVATPGSYRKIQFVERAFSSREPQRSSPRKQRQHISRLENYDIRNLEDGASPGRRGTVGPAWADVDSPVIANSVRDGSEHRNTQTPNTGIVSNITTLTSANADTVGTFGPIVNSANLLGVQLGNSLVNDYRANFLLPPGDQEIALLRHFCYNICSWLGFGDTKSSFGLDFMILANSHMSLMSAVLAMSATHRGLTTGQGDTQYFEMAARYRQNARTSLAIEDTPVTYITRILLVLEDLLSSKALDWGLLVLQQCGFYEGIASQANSEVVESLVWTFFKFDLAASIMDNHAPAASLDILRESIERSALCTPKKYACQMMFLHLAHCLRIIYGDRGPTCVSSDAPILYESAPSEKQLSDFWSQWVALWNECQNWYHNRSADMQPLVAISSKEAGEINPKDTASFPIVIYADSLALITNVVYHITALLLLRQKPRLSRVSAHLQCLTSTIWHASYIAGIVTCNSFTESWNPVVAAGVSLILKDMTHESQKSALLAQLKRMEARIGINLNS